MGENRSICVCAEDTPAAAAACKWVVDEIYKEGDKLDLIFVVKSLKPPMEVFHSVPNTSYSFANPGTHNEIEVINAAKQAIEARYLPILKPKMVSHFLKKDMSEKERKIISNFLPSSIHIINQTQVRYELHLYAERFDASPTKIGDIILNCIEERDPAMVVLAAHNKKTDSDRFEGQVGSVAAYITSKCQRPLAIIRP